MSLLLTDMQTQSRKIVHYAPKTQSVSFPVSMSFWAERSEAAKVTRARIIQNASVIVYTIFVSEGRKITFCILYGSREILNVLYCFTLSISRPLCREKSFCGLRTNYFRISIFFFFIFQILNSI